MRRTLCGLREVNEAIGEKEGYFGADLMMVLNDGHRVLTSEPLGSDPRFVGGLLVDLRNCFKLSQNGQQTV